MTVPATCAVIALTSGGSAAPLPPFTATSRARASSGAAAGYSAMQRARLAAGALAAAD